MRIKWLLNQSIVVDISGI